ncbi:hypothetical protein [Streptomyces inhibens]|uniref:hypothetical protein n=1 Tax=Streptomyces inhibens TaxID=2293571 RepID=UPI001EE6E4CD|nr:hypothetical protein [Streptomyces inhibens]UKY47405.1 hypothetical protein KI385_00060 [Streptomyces inhibens]
MNPVTVVVRVGEHAGWAFAIEYGHCESLSRLEEVSREGVEAVYYSYNPEHPPTIVLYARDGRSICGFGLGEERVRWGQEPDLLVPRSRRRPDPHGRRHRSSRRRKRRRQRS